jgi:hypothetical protein
MTILNAPPLRMFTSGPEYMRYDRKMMVSIPDDVIFIGIGST